jgi:hypothetical protein
VPNPIQILQHEREAEHSVPRGAVERAIYLSPESNLGRIVRLAIAMPLMAVSFAALSPFAGLPVGSRAAAIAPVAEVRAPIGNLGAALLEIVTKRATNG